MSVSLFERSDASCANVAVRFLAVFNVGNFLYVYFERSSRLTVGVANVVAGCLTLTANITYSGHIDTSDFWVIFTNFSRFSAFHGALLSARSISEQKQA